MDKAQKRRKIFIGIYILILVILGFRPKIAGLAAIKPSSDIGTWSMYKYLVKERVFCFLETSEGRVPVDWRSHLYHGTFLNSAHPNFHESMGDEFIEFLSKKNPTVLDYKKKGKPFALHLYIQSVLEKKDTTQFHFQKNF
jgi:hypothetical protein